MKEIKFPANKKYWICHNDDGSVMHFGETETNQVTSTGLTTLDGFDNESALVTAIASKSVSLFPPIPAVGQQCELNKVYAYGANKAKCVQAHTRMNFTPESTPALWLVILTVIGYPVWKQPTGAHDAYAINDIVHYPTINDGLWKSKIAANVTVPNGDIPYNRYWTPYTP